jgi:hypothetical protein
MRCTPQSIRRSAHVFFNCAAQGRDRNFAALGRDRLDRFEVTV